MTEPDLEPLPEDLRDFLDAERELDVPAAETRTRLLTRLAPLLLVPPAGVPVNADPGDAAGAAASGATGLAKTGLAAKLLVPAICTALGAAGGAATHAYLAGRASPAASQSAAPAVTQPVEPAPSASSATAAPSADAAVELAPPPASSASARAVPQPPPPAGSLRAERLLLESATAALMRGDSASALATLQKHARLFPRGALVQEREVLLIKVLRAQGKDAAAERRAKEFKQQFPSSLQQGAVDEPGEPK